MPKKFSCKRFYLSDMEKYDLLKFEESREENLNMKNPYFNYAKIGHPEYNN